ncbi:hypothetical protein JJD41_23690 [Oxynema sp. CENA135]|uniref:hypothetical protein n=1 Tax=Oxynema sp. CENA135 TaxID=984206 RepID=UPI00190CAC63|nr:hypothetical protein [Oxynema sp. CENA135]MBK4732847.1 hypothetical protein [Oxynema sp. CENA135]
MKPSNERLFAGVAKTAIAIHSKSDRRPFGGVGKRDDRSIEGSSRTGGDRPPKG